MNPRHLLTLFLVFVSFEVFACKCPSGENAIEFAYGAAEWVFVGTYIKEELDSANDSVKGYFDITKEIKGDFGKFSFSTRPITTSHLRCVAPVMVGVNYLVFLPRDGHFSYCNFTRPLVSKSQNEHFVYTAKTLKRLEKLEE